MPEEFFRIHFPLSSLNSFLMLGQEEGKHCSSFALVCPIGILFSGARRAPAGTADHRAQFWAPETL